jgi:hypothetical protein
LYARPCIEALGFDSRFMRTWEYYLSYCEVGFAVDAIAKVKQVRALQYFCPSVSSKKAGFLLCQAGPSHFNLVKIEISSTAMSKTIHRI